MTTDNDIKNIVLEKLARSVLSEPVTEIWEKGTEYTLETEYRLTTLQTGNIIYTIAQTYKEHYNYWICGCGPSWRYRNKISIWEQEEGAKTSAFRYSESIRERKHTDPDGPWELKHLAHKEATNPNRLPPIQIPSTQPGWKKISETNKWIRIIQRSGQVMKGYILSLLETGNEHTR